MFFQPRISSTTEPRIRKDRALATKKTLAMRFKLSQQVEKGWRKLRGFKEIPFVLEGVFSHANVTTNGQKLTTPSE